MIVGPCASVGSLMLVIAYEIAQVGCVLGWQPSHVQHCRFSICLLLKTASNDKHTSELRQSAKKKSQLPYPLLPFDAKAGGEGGEKATFPPGPLHPLLLNELMKQHHHLSNWLQPWSSPGFLQIPTGRKPFFLSVFPRNSWQPWHSYSWKCSIGHLLEESADWWNWTDLVLRAVHRSLPLLWCLGTCLCSVPRPPTALACPPTGFRGTPARVQPALHRSGHRIQCTGNCISLLAAVPWLSRAARTIAAAWRQMSPACKFQSCPLCTQAPVPWKSCARTERGVCMAWGHWLADCAVPACPQYKHMLEMGFQLLCHIVVCSSEEAQGELMLGESFLRWGTLVREKHKIHVGWFLLSFSWW